MCGHNDVKLHFQAVQDVRRTVESFVVEPCIFMLVRHATVQAAEAPTFNPDLRLGSKACHDQDAEVLGPDPQEYTLCREDGGGRFRTLLHGDVWFK